jgi:hypothetical protein
MRKVGGLYFWNLGVIGGSVYLPRLPYHYTGCADSAIVTILGAFALGVLV